MYRNIISQKKKKIKRKTAIFKKVLKFTIIVIALFFGTKMCVKSAYNFRGYEALGAEWVALPILAYILPLIGKTLQGSFCELKNTNKE